MRRFLARHRRRIFFAVIATVVFLALAEIAVRLSGLAVLPAEHTFTDVYNPGYSMLPAASNPYAPVAEVLNLDGFRGPRFAKHKTPALYRILSVGDSTTFGVNVEWDRTYTYLLQKRLERRRPVEILNAGMPGTAMWQQRMFVEKTFAGFQPDLVIWYTGPSYRADYFAMREAMAGKDITWPLRRGMARFHVYRLLRRYIRPPRFVDVANQYSGTDNNFLQEEDVAAYARADAAAVAEVCAAHSARLLVVPRISRGAFEDSREAEVKPNDVGWRKKTHKSQGTALLYVALEELKIPHLDTAGPFLMASYEEKMFMDVCHFTVAGHELMARLLFDALCRDRLAGPVCERKMH